METNERIRELRKYLNLSQAEFAERLGTTRDVIGNIEYNRLKRPEQKESLYKLICKEFDVNEEWLRTGNGEMFVPLTREETIAKFAGELMKEESSSFKKKLVEVLAKLDESQWEVLEDIANMLTKKD